MPKMGTVSTNSFTFEWPKPEDLAKMPLNQPIQISDLLLKKNGDFVSSLQIKFSNG